MTDYYELTLADGISGDDVNRHLREKNLGFAPAHESWADAGSEIRCIYPGQTITRVALDTRVIYVYDRPAFFNPDNKLHEAMRIAD